jgi:Protein of unknown function (DUF1566)
MSDKPLCIDYQKKRRTLSPIFSILTTMHTLCLSSLLLLACWVTNVRAACPSLATSTRFTINDAEVTDKITGLVWARCSVGQTWTGSTCTGTASTFTHEQALQHAKSQEGWRLPNVKELSSMLDRGCQNPAIDSEAFPSTPSWKYWSSSPVATDSARAAWYVDTYYGQVILFDQRSNPYIHIRLVRTSK